jgi:hypothetical protein
VQSNRLPASTRLELCGLSSLPPPERGNVSRYTREHRGVGYLSVARYRCCCLVSGSIYSTRTHDLRNSRGSPISLSLSLARSLARSLIPLLCARGYVCILCLPPNDLLLLPARRISRRRGFTARGIRTTLIRLRALLPVSRRIPSLPSPSLSFSSSLSLSLSLFLGRADIFLRAGWKRGTLARDSHDRSREEIRARLPREGWFLLFCGSAPPAGVVYDDNRRSMADSR